MEKVALFAQSETAPSLSQYCTDQVYRVSATRAASRWTFYDTLEATLPLSYAPTQPVPIRAGTRVLVLEIYIIFHEKKKDLSKQTNKHERVPS